MVYLLRRYGVALHPSARDRLVRGAAASLLVHGVLLALVASIDTPAPAPQSASPARVSIVQVRSSTLAAAETTPRRREREAPFRDSADDQPSPTIPLTLRNAVTDEEFTIDLARIRRRRNDLFPFVTWDLQFLDGRTAAQRSNGVAFPSQYLPAATTGNVFRLSSDELQALVDRAWSRRERWSNLGELVGFAERYDGNQGDLPRAFRGYLEQDVPQPYEDHGAVDPLFWVLLTLASDDAPLVEYASRYIQAHPPNRVATELLFLLDTSAETSCDVLARVLDVGTPTLTLDATRRGKREAYDLAVSLATAYRSWIRRFQVDFRERCSAARVTLLRRIIDTSPDGYGVADARFRLGALLWKAERYDEAAAWWRGMRLDDERGVFAQAVRELRGAVEDGAVEGNPGRIDRILLDQKYRWREAANARLRYFGGAADRF